MDSTEKDYPKKSSKQDFRNISKKCNKGNNDGAVESLSRRQNSNKQSNGYHHNGFKQPILKPRISKLENLEAKMASIEVSLSNNNNDSQLPFPYKRVAQSNCMLHNSNQRHQCNAIYFSANTINSIAKIEASNQLSPSAKHSTSANDRPYMMEEMDNLRDRLNEKDAIICSLREQTNHIKSSTQENVASQYVNLNNAWSIDSTSKETKEDKAGLIQRQIDNKSVIIKNLKIKLESLEVKDLDSRIRQAELECLLEKEEMKILNLKEELINMKSNNQKVIENGNRSHPTTQRPNNDELTLYSVVINSNCTIAIAFEISYDNSTPCFFVTSSQIGSGLVVQWAKENSKLRKGDRLLEINGQSVVNCSKENFIDMLKSSAIIHLKMVVLRNTNGPLTRKGNIKEIDAMKDEMSSLVNKLDNKIKENRELLISVQQLQKETSRLKNDNQRLHHRTLYLEDQVNDLAQCHQTKVKPAIAENKMVSGSKEAIVPSNQMQRCLEAPATSTNTALYVSNVQQTIVNRTLHCSNALLKSDRTNVVQVGSRNNSNSERHVLQVKIPFSNGKSHHERFGHYSIQPYVNVPMGHRALPGQYSIKDKESSNVESWIHGRWAGADSDSGNYSGDSMDDSKQATLPKVMTGFILQRQVPQHHVTVTAINADDDIKVRNHCYMNVQSNKKLLTAIKDTEERAKSALSDNESTNEKKSAKSNQIIQYKKPGKVGTNSNGNSHLTSVPLQTVNDGEMEIEEWC